LTTIPLDERPYLARANERPEIVSNTPLIALAIIALTFASTAPVGAQEVPTDEPEEESTTVWSERPHRITVSAGYPSVLDIRYSFAVLPRLRAGASFVGLAPLLFGGALQCDYLVFEGRLGTDGFVTGSAGLQALLLKYNLAIVGAPPNDIDWGIGPELALDIGVGWFSAGLGVGLLVGDWRSLERDIGPEVTPGSNVVVTFTVPRISVSW
jgi:hypothetical protein